MNAPTSSLTPRRRSEIAFGESDFQRIAAFAKSEYGLHLEPSKKAMIHSRLGKRIVALNLDGFTEYDKFLRANLDTESDHFISALTTNVTNFYREKHHFEQLQSEVLPRLVERARSGGRVRLWSAGCSSGPEPYSLSGSVILLCPEAPKLNVRILATDIDPFVLRRAEAAVYSDEEAKIPPGAWANQVFEKSGGAKTDFRVRADVRSLVSFRQLNINGHWPMSGLFDVIMCRNMAIYFDNQTQQTLWRRLAEQLVPGGMLFIGHSERVSGPATGMLEAAGVTAYRKRSAS
ncbi:protein-glutamate O-methyltransferase CheR [Rhodovulum sp. BSW8]|uniref:Chemotaxis protein methyltransferase n=1 Tax=Rhodovulum visakhapatnamense TaxID=364297 RepID=A0ABS1RE62_9RHOB|nr:MULTISPECIES: protein-glutamate O-methyltransferase CheR [Rhodovulum]MBL3568046.1 protein-glutamate O-methyltransferase CheR [Rhodovulum visakhapatnamense]MBL3577931.1 protein-glutamate O-methyltransferase CheR [Rhodovulum visakhapatnamense]OLS46231.1 chemotaxis protein [Rhodovulum sulfidophilum]RBO51484.1 protein-glutamate O-methyltransferase CheR [Rhodovulum sp. BSW8]